MIVDSDGQVWLTAREWGEATGRNPKSLTNLIGKGRLREGDVRRYKVGARTLWHVREGAKPTIGRSGRKRGTLIRRVVTEIGATATAGLLGVELDDLAAWYHEDTTPPQHEERLATHLRRLKRVELERDVDRPIDFFGDDA